MQVQSVADSLGKWGCLCFCDVFIAGGNPYDVFAKYNDLVDSRIIENDAYILDHENLIYYVTGRRHRYVRSNTPPKDGRLYIANFKYNSANHFVVMKDGKVYWNSLDSSACVNHGREEKDYRWIE